MNFTWLHVFPYSQRAGTPAARMPQVKGDVRKERAARLRDLGQRAILQHLDALVGQRLDPRIKLYNDIQNMSLKDIVDFQKQWVKGRTYVYCILGDKKDLELDKLKAVGPIEELTQEQIFGY
jgi:predicted Zn-dependent peptidase